MKRYSLQDLMQMRMTGVEEFYLASDVDAAHRILRDELNKDEHVMEADQARVAELEQELDLAFQMLEIFGVPKERARTVRNGIVVLTTRCDREIGTLKGDLKISAERIAQLEAALREIEEKISSVSILFRRCVR